MKQRIITLLLILMTLNSFGQHLTGKKAFETLDYSEDSRLKVIIDDPSKNLYASNKPVGVFIDGTFVGELTAFSGLNSKKIDSLSIEKERFKKNGKTYYGKVFVKMTSDYTPKFITLKKLLDTYLKLDRYPVVFQINDTIIDVDYKTYIVDENYILKMISRKIKTSKKHKKINLITLITKTPENIKKANTIRIGVPQL